MATFMNEKLTQFAELCNLAYERGGISKSVIERTQISLLNVPIHAFADLQILCGWIY